MTALVFLAQAADDIRDIVGPAPIAESHWLAWSVAGAAAAGLGGLSWWWWQRGGWRKMRRRSPQEQALAQLEEARALLRAELAREFVERVSRTVREYLQARFALAITHQTSEEFLQNLSTAPPPELAPHAQALREFLRHCDLVKFGQGKLTEEQMARLLESARRLVVETAPRPSAKPSERP